MSAYLIAFIPPIESEGVKFHSIFTGITKVDNVNIAVATILNSPFEENHYAIQNGTEDEALEKAEAALKQKYPNWRIVRKQI